MNIVAKHGCCGPIALSLCAIVVLGCKARTNVAPRPEHDRTSVEDQQREPPPHKYVVVAGNAKLLAAPRKDAQGFHLSPGSPWDPGEAHRFSGHVFRVAGWSEGFVAIDTIPLDQQGRHCNSITRALDPFDFRLYVDSEAVREVVTESFSAEDASGLRLQVFPGEQLDHGVLELLESHCGDCRTQIEVGKEYEPGDWRALDRAEQILCDDGTIRDNCSGTPVYAVRPLGDQVAATLNRNCHLYEVRASAGDAVDDAMADAMDEIAIIGVIEGGGASFEEAFGSAKQDAGAAEAAPPATVRAGAPAFWRDGTKAGELRVDREFDQETDREGNRRCFRHVVTCVKRSFTDSKCEQASSFEICFDASQVIEQEQNQAP